MLAEHSRSVSHTYKLDLEGIYIQCSQRYNALEDSNLKKVFKFLNQKNTVLMTFLYVSNKCNIRHASQLYKDICTKICCNILKRKTGLKIIQLSTKGRLIKLQYSYTVACNAVVSWTTCTAVERC